MELRDKVVVITGASSGIGAATALHFATHGARLVLAARSADKLTALEKRIVAAGGYALAVPTDVADDTQVHGLAETVFQYYENVDVLVNNAGIGIYDPFVQAELTDLDRMVQVNLYGAVRCTKAFLPQMLHHRCGHIINVASIASIVATPNLGFYTTTKFALLGMSRSLHLDLRGTGIRVSAICPHVVQTEFFDQADKSQLAQATRLLPWLQAEDVAQAIAQQAERNRSGEVVLPHVARPLIALARAAPGLASLIIRLLG